MKKAIGWIIFGIIAGLVGGYFYTSCKDGPLKKENAQLKVEIADMKVVQTQLEETSLKQIARLLDQIGGLQGNIDSLMFVNVGLENDLAVARARTTELEAAAGPLLTEVQPVLDANPRVKELVMNLLGQVASGKDQIFTLTKQVETWKGAFSSSELKGLDYKKGMDVYKGLWEGEKSLRMKVEQRLALQDLRVVSLENKFRLTGIGGIAVGIAVVVLLVSHR